MIMIKRTSDAETVLFREEALMCRDAQRRPPRARKRDSVRQSDGVSLQGREILSNNDTRRPSLNL